MDYTLTRNSILFVKIERDSQRAVRLFVDVVVEDFSLERKAETAAEVECILASGPEKA